ncbi:sodium-independent anion transporter [bacterium (Candidatus Blackallbacteria) CG17_big_fil_post_rev_8_21_14_2_50_48_46]|uniref:Sodium-independent anion transporter n=1 Tax=bacterium (Candidatus Blackallbacteria) CG17_big_fil_post_rev_8_21_14_2_50_48_46 TaxID=2014261 RepID=A0A2M7G141_9BACT|nr:MAG: sodium-independent anion transporter [bacterium (Candidatus Blackallbacteria) CG18_big_fil_WC_8_21_14_2_50_49_26]PIW15257.1 MAG: sodium-independent anion transporter [bacterium (Candidatus Blackallbacteria) CG17_big_fil_post_rev_8_21_14_2_50_48_46]PIW45234.1 MAG: sodium-independent anion transporter [bacterium (Candidatus Blackallbacteria) CG13_big_fil_rev_8_21_14_2_50_49_14]
MLQKISAYLSPQNFKPDLLSGLTVALALIPEAIAFAFVAKVDPMVGLYAAFMVSLIAGLLSGRPGMISGATGALAVVMVSLVVSHGVQYLFAAVVLMGLIQILAGLFKLGKFSRMIPHPVMLGFVNGLAIVIMLAQIPQMQTQTPEGHWGWLHGEWLPPQILVPMLALIALTMAITHFLPKLTRAVPSSLAAIVLISLGVGLFQLQTPTVADMLKGQSLHAALPAFQIPAVPLTFETLKIILPYSLILAFIGLIESLMTLALIDEITETRGQTNRECLAQGTANIITGFFGGMGGCAMIGQSMINIQSGGRGRLACIVAGLGLLTCILFAAPLMTRIPLAALVGVMFMVVIGTFEWSSLRILGKIPKSDAFVLILVSGVTVLTDLATAVLAGIVVSALVFSWKKAEYIQVESSLDAEGGKHYQIKGYLFFASVQNFLEAFDVKADPLAIYIDFEASRIMDHSGLEAVHSLTEKYLKQGKELHLYHLSQECRELVKKAEGLIQVNVKTGPLSEVSLKV